MTPNCYRTKINEFEFTVKGTYYNPDWSETSQGVQTGEELSYRREEQNEFAPYAIIIMKGESLLGYIPREYAKLIASEIDIESSKYIIIVSSVNPKEKYNEIEVQMIKTE